MRKLLAFFTLVVLATASIVSAINQAPRIDIKKQDLKADPVSTRDIISAEWDDTPFDQSAHGYGWYIGDNRKIDYDVESGNLGTIFRKKHDDGSGTMGGLSGEWGDYESMYLYPGNEELGGRYPSTVTYGGYHFGVFGRASSDAAGALTQAKVLVYDIDDESWTAAFDIVSPDGVTPVGVWSPLLSCTYDDAASEYVLSITLEVYGLNAAEARTTSIVTGRTATPADTDSWVWSDCTDLEFAAGGNVIEAGKIKIGWGKTDKNFGCAVSVQKIDPLNENYHLTWMRTDDFGDSWSMEAGTFHVVDTSTLFPWYGTMFTPEGGEPTPITDVGMTMTFDAIGSYDNKVHVLAWVYGQTDANITRENDEGVPTSGWYDIVGTRDGAGMSWTPYFIAHKAGWQDEIGGYAQTFEGRYINRYAPSLGIADNGVIVASWLDRPIENGAGSVIEAIYAGPGLNDPSTYFIDDAYVTTSASDGRFWEVDEFRRALNVTNTVDLDEEGWTISGNVKAVGDEVEFYAAHQYADFAVLAIPPADDFGNFQQDLHAWKLSGEFTNINAEEISLTKEFNLAQNYPNPFNPTTSINFVLKNSGKVNLSVFNTKGEVVSVLANEQMTAGTKSFTFDASNFNSGVYFYQLNVNGITESKKMVLTK